VEARFLPPPVSHEYMPTAFNRHPRPKAASGVVWHGQIRLGHGHSIEFSLHLAFVLTLVVVTWLLARVLFPRLFPGWSPVSYWLVACAVSVADSLAAVSHELGHAFAALAKGRRAYRITLYGLAAAARGSSGSERPRDCFAIALAGPVSHLLVASALLVAWNALPIDNQPLRVAAGFPAASNFAMGVFNLLPVSPLDGGRMLRALFAATAPL
jgi:Zn-dependent protease